LTERGPAGAERLTEAFEESYRAVVGNAVEVQTRNFELAQGWVDGVTGVLESQAEANRALTRAMESYVKVVDEALKSQERTNRALAESMESYREVVEKVSELQEKNTELTRGFFEGVTGELRQGAESSQAMVRDLAEGSRKQMEAFQQMLGEAMASYTSLMNAPYELYRKNLDAMRKMGE
jgi:hypothetical protein